MMCKLQPQQDCFVQGNFWKVSKLKAKRKHPKNRVLGVPDRKQAASA